MNPQSAPLSKRMEIILNIDFRVCRLPEALTTCRDAGPACRRDCSNGYRRQLLLQKHHLPLTTASRTGSWGQLIFHFFVFFLSCIQSIILNWDSISLGSMLPSRPNVRNGLPPRSRSAGRQRPAETLNYNHTRHDSLDVPSSPRHVPRQRSLAALPVHPSSGRSRPPVPQISSPPRPFPGAHRPKSDDSVASGTSSGSSFLDRMRGGGGYASSRTSLEDEEEPPKRGRRPETQRARDQHSGESSSIKILNFDG